MPAESGSRYGVGNVRVSLHVKESFQRQGIMRLLGARISKYEPGHVEISAPNRPRLSQQDGYVHAGVMATLADSAGGYAALSLLPRGSRVLAVEFKLNFTRPAVGKIVRATGRVRKLGRTIAVCELEVELQHEDRWLSCAWGSQTVYCIRGSSSKVA
ncbi:PaaI family thioesterase [Candidatus Bathyarchaeota archaeon]|nr:MAG: PaaI family thioesterase [Candidatus Bathyarchaeota archaeon]TMI31926.1 MAG: PaaI family thioesterase [Candidatus Bathyarchaeota archaeon]